MRTVCCNIAQKPFWALYCTACQMTSPARYADGPRPCLNRMHEAQTGAIASICKRAVFFATTASTREVQLPTQAIVSLFCAARFLNNACAYMYSIALYVFMRYSRSFFTSGTVFKNNCALMVCSQPYDRLSQTENTLPSKVSFRWKYNVQYVYVVVVQYVYLRTEVLPEVLPEVLSYNVDYNVVPFELPSMKDIGSDSLQLPSKIATSWLATFEGSVDMRVQNSGFHVTVTIYFQIVTGT